MAEDNNPYSFTEALASDLHDQWRAPRLLSDGTYEPRWKDDGAGGQVDIANTAFKDLPPKWQAETYASAESASNAMTLATGSEGKLDANGAPDVDFMADLIHKDWLKRNNSYATDIQKLPYDQLPEEEKEKDRIFARTALSKKNIQERMAAKNSSIDKNMSNSNSIKNTGKEIAKETAKKQAAKAIGKSIEGSKIAAGGTGNPASSIVSGVSDAGEAIKNKDAMGVADAGVKTAAVLGANAVAGPVAGAVTERILNTKAGKKTTRLVSRLLLMSVLAPIVGLILLLAMVGGIVGGIFQNGGGQSLTALNNPCLNGADLAITDQETLSILKPIVSNATSSNYAVLGVMAYLVDGTSETALNSDPTKAATILYKKIRALGFGKDLGTTIVAPPWQLYYEVLPKNSSSTSSSTSTPSPDPSASLDRMNNIESDYAMMYPTAYWTVSRMLLDDPALAKSLDTLNYPLKDYTQAATAFVNGDSGVPSCDGALNQFGVLTDSGKEVLSFTQSKTVNLNITSAKLDPKTHIITYSILDSSSSKTGTTLLSTLSSGSTITVSGLSEPLFNINNATIISLTANTFSIKDTSNTKSVLSVSGESGSGVSQSADAKLPSHYNVAYAVAKALAYEHNAPPTSPQLPSGNCINTGCSGDCDHLAGIIWGHRDSGYETALDHWNEMIKAGVGHPNDISPPVGALLFWGGNAKDPHPMGHVAVYVGKFLDPADKKVKDYVISNWYGGLSTANVYKMTLGEIASDNFNYLGWSEPIFRGPLL